MIKILHIGLYKKIIKSSRHVVNILIFVKKINYLFEYNYLFMERCVFSISFNKDYYKSVDVSDLL